MRHQSYAYGHDHFALDPDLPAVLSHFWPGFSEHKEHLGAFGRLCGGEAYEVVMHVDAGALPIHRMHDLDGHRVDRVELCPAHMDLLRRLAPMNRPPYEGGSWHEHFALGYLLADPGLYCTLIVTNQTAYAIHKYAPEHDAWKQALLAGERWGATWMTETQGGSDLGANLARAEQTRDGCRLYGTDKYFAKLAALYAAKFIARQSYPSWAMDEQGLWLPPETEVLAAPIDL